MATPITHIVLAEKVFNKHFADKDRKKLLVGTSLPDIKHLGVITREKAHFCGLTINNLKEKDSFEAGFQFHSLVDEIREKFVGENDIYSFRPFLAA